MLAVLSDIHANLPALDACLQHAQAHGATRYAVAGDLVGYGGAPQAVVTRIRALGAAVCVVRGNHDAAACQVPASSPDIDAEARSGRWTHQRLSAEQREWLAQLPLWSALPPDLLLVHASAQTPADWTYVDRPQRARASLQAAQRLDVRIRGVLCGHVHQPALFHPDRNGHWLRFDPRPGIAMQLPIGRCWVACCGSVGQPRDGDPRAAYMLFDPAARRLTLHRIDYDIAAAMHAILTAAGDPDDAERLLEGR